MARAAGLSFAAVVLSPNPPYLEPVPRLLPGELVGFGTDYAYLAALGSTATNKFAVLHEFQVGLRNRD
jgi:hypothetical protein